MKTTTTNKQNKPNCTIKISKKERKNLLDLKNEYWMNEWMNRRIIWNLKTHTQTHTQTSNDPDWHFGYFFFLHSFIQWMMMVNGVPLRHVFANGYCTVIVVFLAIFFGLFFIWWWWLFYFTLVFVISFFFKRIFFSP